MPKSKSTRGKSYRPKRWDSHALYIDQRDLKALQGIFTDIGLIVEVKLPNGTCTEDDVQLMRDYINLTSLLIYAGHHVDTSFVIKEYGTEWVNVQERFHSYYERVTTEGKYVATGDELCALRSGMEIADAVVKMSFKKEPFWCLKTYRYMKTLTDREHGRIKGDPTSLEKRIRAISMKRI